MNNQKRDFVKLATVQGQLTANVLKSHLESEGIPAILSYESAGTVIGITVNGLGKVDILVPEELLSMAEEVISSDQSVTDI